MGAASGGAWRPCWVVISGAWNWPIASMFTLPGTPVLRYGDEIGMGDDQALPERQAVRTPMQWHADLHGGFSTAEKTVLPAVREGPFGYHRVNVAEQRRDPGSLLNCTERASAYGRNVQSSAGVMRRLYERNAGHLSGSQRHLAAKRRDRRP